MQAELLEEKFRSKIFFNYIAMAFDVDGDVLLLFFIHQFKDNLDWPRGFVSLFPNGSVQLPLQY